MRAIWSFDLIASAADRFDPDRAGQTGFTHLIAGAKKHPEPASRLERRVRRDYPEYYDRCIKLGRSISSATIVR